MQSSRIKRALGGMEKQQWVLGQGSVFNLVINAEITGPTIDPAMLERALNELQAKQFYLHTRLGKKNYPNIKDDEVKKIPVQLSQFLVWLIFKKHPMLQSVIVG